MKAILVMLSNYFHDLAVALLFSSMLLSRYLHQTYAATEDKGNYLLVQKVIKVMIRVALASWMWILIGGVIRTVNYYDYEWLPAAGRGQVTALALKHVILGGAAIYGALIQYRLSKLYIRGKS